MAVNKRLLQGAAAAGGLVPSEHFGVVLYEGDGSNSHSINGGKFGAATNFNGTTSQITTSNITGLDTTTISISCWVYMHEVGTFNHFVSRFGTGGHSTYQFILRNTSAAKWSLATYDGTGSGDSLTSTATASANTWYHVAAVIDGTSKKIYVNGSEVASSTVAFSVNTSSGEGLNIGGRDDFGASNTERMNGVIDQVRVFNKALSASEVTTLYNENSLVASYRFEGNAEDDTRNYDGTASNVTYEYGLGFTPDFVWIKARDAAYSHNIQDSSRGGGSSNTLNSNVNVAAGTYGIYGYVNSFDTGGFTVNAGSTNSVHVNNNGTDYVAFCLKANGGTTSSNTDGSITSTVQKNSNDSFSIITYTGNGTSGATVGHGLSVAPELLLFKRLNAAESWNAWASAFSSKVGFLNTDDTFINYSVLATNTSTITLNNGTGHNASAPYVCYAFASVSGFSKINSYTGNGSSQLIETGFEPAFVIIKSISAFGDWRLYDNKRGSTDSSSSYVGNRKPLYGNLDIAEGNGVNEIRFLSTGFEVGPGNNTNTSGVSFIYMAFAADPDTVVPTKAKSFSTVTYTGDGTNGKEISGLGFQPNLVWIKPRSFVDNHAIADSIRGIGKTLVSNSTSAENSLGLASFDSDGFTLADPNWNNINQSGQTFVAWAWKADDNEPTLNTDGSINSLVSANSNAGFSIVKYAGNGTAGATIGHGLSSTPEFLIVKCISGTDSGSTSWHVYTPTTGATKTINLNSDAAASTNSLIWNNTAPTSTVFSVANNTETNNTGRTYIAYCFHSVSGFSKIGSYTGNGNSSGPTVTTGFQPDWIMIKNTSAIAAWMIIDSVRGTSLLLQPQSSAVEENVGTPINFTSTGFQITDTNASRNRSGDTYIYMAFKIN